LLFAALLRAAFAGIRCAPLRVRERLLLALFAAAGAGISPTFSICRTQ
jgi:hypothetical protein